MRKGIRTWKRFLALMMTMVLALTSVNLPVVSVYADDSDDEAVIAGATPGDAATAQNVFLGVTNVELGEDDEYANYKFTPSEDGAYVIYSTGDNDSQVNLYDGDGYFLADDDDSGEKMNFKLTYPMKAGMTYVICINFLTVETVKKLNLHIEKKSAVKSIKISNPYTKFLERVYYTGFIYFDAEVTYADESKVTGKYRDGRGDILEIDGVQYSMWIKDKNGSYRYANEDYGEINYTDVSDLEAGTYTIEITDYQEDRYNGPEEGLKVWASYEINVLKADEYFVGRQTLVEGRKQNYNIGEYVQEYYKFVPSASGDYVISGDYSILEKDVFKDDFSNINPADKNNGVCSVQKGNTYYIGFKGYRNGENGESLRDANLTIDRYSAPESIAITMTRTEFPMEYAVNPVDYMQATLKRKDGSTEILSLESGWQAVDIYGNVYTITYSSDGQNYDYYYGSLYLNAGTYHFCISTYIQGELVLLGSTQISGVALGNMDLPVLKAGAQNLHSSSSLGEYNDNIYKYIPAQAGILGVSSRVSYAIYTIKDGEQVEVEKNDILYPGSVYYIEFYGGWYDSDTDEIIYDHTVEVQQQSYIEQVRVVQKPDQINFIKGLDPSMYLTAVVEVRYSNGETERVVPDEGYYRTKYGYSLDLSFMHDNKVINVERLWEEVDVSKLPYGELEVVLTAPGGAKCSYVSTISRVTDKVAGTLQVGENSIDVENREKTFYTFTPSESGVYELAPCNLVTTGHEELVDGEYVFVVDSTSSYEIFLEKDRVYYCNFENGISDKWDEPVYKWTMNLKMAENGQYSAPRKWQLSEGTPEKKYVYIEETGIGAIISDTEGTCIDITYENDEKTTTEISSESSLVDQYRNRLKTTVQKYNADTGAYADYTEYSLESGHYRMLCELESASGVVYSSIGNLEIPFDVYGVTDAPDGTWDITQPLYVKNTQNTYLYKVDIPSGVKSITIGSNADMNSIDVYNGEGEEISTAIDCDDMYAYSLSLDTDLSVIYLKICPDPQVDVCKLTAVNNQEVVAISTIAKKTDYIHNMERVNSGYFITTKVYRDGTSKVVSGTNGGVNLTAVDEDGTELDWLGDLTQNTGKYTIIPSCLNMSSACSVSGATVNVSDLDMDDVASLTLGKKMVETNKTDKIYTKVYSFIPTEDMNIAFSVDEESQIYTVDDEGNIESLGDTYSVVEAEKGKNYCVPVIVNAKSSAYIQVNTVRKPVKIEDTITTGTDKQLTMVDNDMAYLTFVPEVSGVYNFKTYDNDNSIAGVIYAGELSDEDVIASDYAEGENGNINIQVRLEKGTQYICALSVYGQCSFKVSVKQLERDKDISSVRYVKDTFVAERERGEESVYVSGDMEITYTDNTVSTIPFRYGQNKDKYDNVVQCMYDAANSDGKEQAVVSARYRNRDSSQWTDLPEMRLDVRIYDSGIIQRLTEDVTFDSGSITDEVKGFNFKPSTTGRYVIDIESPNGYYDLKVEGREGDYVNPEESSYYLETGVDYYITFEQYGEYRITIRKTSAIADIEIIEYKGDIYKGIYGQYGSKVVNVKVIYADGQESLVAGGNKLPDGRIVKYGFDTTTEIEATLHVTVGNVHAYKKIPYTDKSKIDSVIFMNGISVTKVAKSDEKYHLYRVVIPASGRYTLIGEPYDTIQMTKINKYWEFADVVLSEPLEAGDVYYIEVPNTVEKFYFASSDILEWNVVKAPTCTTAGLKRKYDTDLGKYVTEEIAATGHSFTHYVSDNNVSCETAGTLTAKCDNGCGKKKVKTDLSKPATGHAYSSKWTTVTHAQFGVDGYKAHICANCGGESLATRKINKISKVTLATTSYTYDGKVHKPEVTVEDSTGKLISKTKYTVTYSNKTSVGKVAVKVAFKGDYTGIVTREFVIKPVGTSITGVANTSQGIKITWKKSNSAGGYVIQRKTGNGKFTSIKTIASNKTLYYIDTTAVRQGVAYTYRVISYKKVSKTNYYSGASAAKTYYFVKGTGIKSAVNKKTNKIGVAWTKNTAASGYQIQYAANNKFTGAKTITISSFKTTSVNISGLKKKTYFIRMRGYKKAGKTTYYSAWSGAKSVKVSK